MYEDLLASCWYCLHSRHFQRQPGGESGRADWREEVAIPLPPLKALKGMPLIARQWVGTSITVNTDVAKVKYTTMDIVRMPSIERISCFRKPPRP